MATISIADSDARVQYTQAVTANSTQLTIDFPFFSLDDINVIVTSAAGVDTTLTRGTGTGTFAVNGTSVDDGFSGGNITLGDSYSNASTKFTIFRDIPVTRTTDFPTSGPFNVSSLNTELDRIIAIEQELQTKIGRTMKLAESDNAATLSLPDLDTRKGTTLAFNSTTGLPEAGPKIGDVSTIAAITADIGLLADIQDGTTATNAITTVSGISENVTTVAGISSNVTTVAVNTSNINAVAGDASDIGTVASNISSVNTNATNITAIQGASANASTATTKASEAAASQTAAASSASSASTSAATATTKAAEAATSAGNASTSETNSAASATAAASSATAAAASQTAAAASAASAATAFDNFDDTYLGSKTSNPAQDNDGNALVSGALYFNSTANEMRVYDGANWIAATSAGNVSLILYEYTATAGQTTFSGSDDNSATLSYTVDNLQVVMNGIVLDPSDFTATNGTSVVLASGAAANDLVNIYAFKSFTTADMVSKTNGGTFAGAVTFGGGANFGDNAKAVFGAGSDFEIRHNSATGENLLNLTSNPLEMHQAGVNSVLELHNDGTNHNQVLQILKGGTLHGSISTDTGKLKIDGAGSLELSDGGSTKLATTSTGINVTGSITADGNVGIGTSSPADELHINSTAANVNLRLTRDTNTGCRLSGSDGSATPAFIVETIASGTATERMRIDSSGNLQVGTTQTFPAFNNVVGCEVGGFGQISASRDGAEAMQLNRKTSDGSIALLKKDGITRGSIGIAGNRPYFSNTDNVGLLFSGDDVRPCNSSGVNRDNAIDLGNATNARFDDIVATNGTIQTSDQNEKQDIASLTTAEITAAKAISKLFKTFKWQDKVAAKGDAARTHTGVIAQEVQTAMTNAGLNASKYAFWCSDTWWEADETYTDDDGAEQTRTNTYDTADEAPEGAAQRTRFGVRYPELLAFIGAATEQRLADIETRLTALEAAE